MKTAPYERIRSAFAAIKAAYDNGGRLETSRKRDGSPLTNLDLAFEKLLFEHCHGSADGWISEERKEAVKGRAGGYLWIVDPIDGTKELVTGIAEWAVSIAVVKEDRLYAAGVYNPANGFRLVWDSGFKDGSGWVDEAPPAGLTPTGDTAHGPRLLVSRSETAAGKWQGFDGGRFRPLPCGSIAYKLALVANGTFAAAATICAKNVWDIAAGVALVEAGGGTVVELNGGRITATSLAAGRKISGLLAVADAEALADLLPAVQALQT